MIISEETLMAFADGQLDAGESARIEAAVAADPALTARVEAHRALRTRVGAAYEEVLDEPAPDHLLNMITNAAPQRTAEVMDLAHLRQSRNPGRWAGWAQWGAMAACFVLGFLVAAPIQLGSSDLVRARGLNLLAHGQLAHALTDRLASDPKNAQAPIHIGQSYLSRGGVYCRTFNAAGRGAVAGVACRDDGRWRVVTAVFSKVQPGPESYRSAGEQTPQAVTDAVAAEIVGAPLDARAETAARAAGWRSPSASR
jgi:hypothetical protein